MSSNHIHDPALYRKLSEPFDTPERAEEAAKAFVEELGTLRVKHRVPDFVYAFSFNVKHEETEVIQPYVGWRGSFGVMQSLVLSLLGKTDFGKRLASLMTEIQKIESFYGLNRNL